jgi:hypothetical protein
MSESVSVGASSDTFGTPKETLTLPQINNLQGNRYRVQG